jgi:hypothetical protein
MKDSTSTLNKESNSCRDCCPSKANRMDAVIRGRFAQQIAYDPCMDPEKFLLGINIAE